MDEIHDTSFLSVQRIKHTVHTQITVVHLEPAAAAAAAAGGAGAGAGAAAAAAAGAAAAAAAAAVAAAIPLLDSVFYVV